MNSTLIRTAFGILALAASALTTTGALAGWHDTGYGHRGYSHEIDTRQDRQSERIRAGRQDGSLSRMEVRELLREQRQIRAMERHFRADGVIDAREFQRLDRALDRASRNIRAEKQDRQPGHASQLGKRFN